MKKKYNNEKLLNKEILYAKRNIECGMYTHTEDSCAQINATI